MPISLDNLATLSGMSRARLTEAWIEVFGEQHRFRPNPELLKTGIAWELQERYEKLMSATLRRRLNQMVDHLQVKEGRKQINFGKRLRSGTTIVKEWEGQNHIVMVLDKEFVYRGKRYRSLSSIAREITGTRWNGPAFFGLRPGLARTAEVSHG